MRCNLNRLAEPPFSGENPGFHETAEEKHGPWIKGPAGLANEYEEGKVSVAKGWEGDQAGAMGEVQSPLTDPNPVLKDLVSRSDTDPALNGP